MIELYPRIPYGTHTLTLDSRVTLTLLFGDAEDRLSELETPVDAWFLDGFAPDRNESMWTPTLYTQIKRCARAGTTVSTFSAAGHVRRALTDAGFEMEKVKGFANKRHMLRGFMTHTPPPEKNARPWFAQPAPRTRGKASVIGAGLAGCQLAHTLSHEGWAVTLYERAPQIASGASGNRMGLVMPRLTRDTTTLSALTLAGVDSVRRTLHDLTTRGHKVASIHSGVIDLAWNEQEQQRLEDGLTRAGIPASCARPVSPEDASTLAGIQIPYSGVWFPDALCVSPRSLCEHLIADC